MMFVDLLTKYFPEEDANLIDQMEGKNNMFLMVDTIFDKYLGKNKSK